MSLPGQGMGLRLTWALERGVDSEGSGTIGGQSTGMTGNRGAGVDLGKSSMLQAAPGL